jgi:signal peptide peptidase SppA
MLLLANYEDYLSRVHAGVLKRSAVADVEASIQAGMEGDSLYLAVGSSAVIPVCGPLSYKYDFYAWLYGGTSYQGLQRSIAMAQANSEISRIVLMVDTPGGDVTGCMETARVIANSKKPIDCMVDPMCASAGLWLASQCRRVMCLESGEVGSLGVQCVVKSAYRMMQEAGIDVSVIRAKISPEKNIVNPYEPLSEEATKVLQSRVDKWGEAFLSAVAIGRKVTREQALEAFGKGRMLDADEALAVGLIDGIGTLEGMLAEQEKTKVAAKYNPHR